MKKKKGSRYTPPKQKQRKRVTLIPWWTKRVYQDSGDHIDYFFRIIDFFENGPPVNSKLTLPVRKVRWSIYNG